MTADRLAERIRKLYDLHLSSDNEHEAAAAAAKARRLARAMQLIPENEEGIVQAEAVDHTRAWLRDGTTRSLRATGFEYANTDPVVPAQGYMVHTEWD